MDSNRRSTGAGRKFNLEIFNGSNDSNVTYRRIGSSFSNLEFRRSQLTKFYSSRLISMQVRYTGQLNSP